MNLFPSRNFLKKIFSILVISSIMFQCTEENIEPEPIVSKAPEDILTQKAATTSALSCTSCTYIVPANTTTIDGKLLGFKPGDVICLNASTTYPLLHFTNIVGSAANPITITNCGGEVTIKAPDKNYIVKTTNSKHFRITGGNTDSNYGIKLLGSNSMGLVLGHLSTDFEIDHIEIGNIGFAGIMAKTDPTCDNATVRGNYTMRNVLIHHNYVHDTGGEALYIGHTSFGGVKLSCGTRLPHTIENISIHNNLVKASGWDGIQLSCATKGASIAYNIVENFSTKDDPIQRSGICLSDGTGGEVHSNVIKNGNGAGILLFGNGDNIIYNNIIVRPSTFGIFCDERSVIGTGYKFINNTIVSSGSDGIKLYSEKVKINLVINNIILAPASNHYVTVLNNTVKLDMSNNHFSSSIDELKFVNAAALNFRLNSTSPAINKGRDIAKFNIQQDHYKSTRLKGNAYDIGASEF